MNKRILPSYASAVHAFFLAVVLASLMLASAAGVAITFLAAPISLLINFSASSIDAATNTSTDTYIATDEAWVKDSTPKANYGNYVNLITCSGAGTCPKSGESSVIRRSFVKFNVSGETGDLV
jgi:hypothetical protein